MSLGGRSRIALAVAAGLTLSVAAVAPAAASSADKQREVEAIADELDRLHERLDILAEDYVVAIDDQRRLTEEVADAEVRVAAMEKRITRLQGDLGKLAVQAFVSGGGSGMLSELIAPGGGGPNDAVQMQYFTEIALNAGTETTDDLDALLDELDEQRSDLEAKRDRASELAEQIAGSRTAAEDARAAYETRYARAQAELGTLLAAEERRRAADEARAAAAALAAAQAAQAAQAAASASSGSSSSGASSSGSSSSGSSSSGSSSSGSSGTGSSGSSDGGSSAPAVSSRVAIVVATARSQIGVPYRFATEAPGVGFDCSGLTKYAWGRAGVYLPHQSRAQFASTPRVSIADAQPGDLIYYYSPISHVGLYLGGGQMIHAPATGKTVSYTTVSWSKVVGVTRPG
jgi:peptidoglycan DL-endopeptidase CwlO